VPMLSAVALPTLESLGSFELFNLPVVDEPPNPNKLLVNPVNVLD